MARHGTSGHAKFYLKSRRLSSATYLEESSKFDEAFMDVQAVLSRLGRVQLVPREHLPNFIFGPDDVVLVLGQDGLVANTLKYTDGQPVIGVNPDPEKYDGLLLPFLTGDLERIVPEVFARRRQLKSVTMAEVHLNDGRSLRAVNDLFIGPKSHTSARYEIQFGELAEDQSSSGVIVSTGMGSTGWFRSLLAGAAAMVEAYGYGQARIAQAGMPVAEIMSARLEPRGRARNETMEGMFSSLAPTVFLDDETFKGDLGAPAPPQLPKFDGSFPWDSKHLCFTVREPFPTKTTGASVVYGKVTDNEPLVITSQMPENGVIFSDGIEADFLDFNSGDVATIALSERAGNLVI